MSEVSEELEARLAKVERKVDSLLKVYSAIADDTLRVCFAIDEIHRVSRGEPLPWDIATALVELHHAQQAAAEGSVDADGTPASQRVEEIKEEIQHLRDEYRKMVKGESP
jgi:archaellum component FlaC